MTINDYSGSYVLHLRGDEFSDFNGFFDDDTFVYVKGTVVVRNYVDKNGNDKVYTKIRIGTMMNLVGVMDRYTSKLNFKMNLGDINEAFCKNLEKVAKKNKGKVPLQCMVVDGVHGLTLTMGSTSLNVSPRAIIPELEQMEGVSEIKPYLKS